MQRKSKCLKRSHRICTSIGVRRVLEATVLFERKGVVTVARYGVAPNTRIGMLASSVPPISGLYTFFLGAATIVPASN